MKEYNMERIDIQVLGNYMIVVRGGREKRRGMGNKEY